MSGTGWLGPWTQRGADYVRELKRTAYVRARRRADGGWRWEAWTPAYCVVQWVEAADADTLEQAQAAADAALERIERATEAAEAILRGQR